MTVRVLRMRREGVVPSWLRLPDLMVAVWSLTLKPRKTVDGLLFECFEDAIWAQLESQATATSASVRVRQPPRMVFAPGESGLDIGLAPNLRQVAIRGWPKVLAGDGVLATDPLDDVHN